MVALRPANRWPPLPRGHRLLPQLSPARRVVCAPASAPDQHQLYVHTALSRNKATTLATNAKPVTDDAVIADEAIYDPLVLEVLGLRGEYAKTNFEDALIRHLETFLVELVNAFDFISCQRRCRIDDEW